MLGVEDMTHVPSTPPRATCLGFLATLRATASSRVRRTQARH